MHTSDYLLTALGDRPLPNKLSGSDLDGDEYDLIPLRELHPPHTVDPGSYPPAPKKLLHRPATIHDIADFVVDFINSDMYVVHFLLLGYGVKLTSFIGWES